MTRLCLSELTLSHFRSHRAARLSLDGRPIALYGPNGAGKTNILEAVSLFSPGRGIRRAAAEELIRTPEALGWKLTAVLQSLHQVHELASWAEPAAPRQVTIDEKSATQTALGRIARMVWLVPSMDRLWIEGADGRRRFLDRIALSFEPVHAENALKYEKAMRERNRLLKDQVRDAHWYVALENQMAEAGVAIQSSRQHALDRLAEAQSSADTLFPTADLSLTAPDETRTPARAEYFAAALAEHRQKDLYAGRTLIGPHRADLDATYAAKGAPAKQCSTGEQKALLISLILANARALAQDFGAPPIVLLDEVAAHLDATRRDALYDEICALGAQAWMTGTGAELFEDLGARAQRFEVTEQDGTSLISERG
ncbi:DNA recombination and repair protein RecF [Candidatus Rhodobacter oscarellae]|uniref:DNA replication and repair protein RecF n=1 Tax=Candidatus Rhodobacter oscarellae TaxID=1675527 RepID=A0A0J9EBE3_9RHOB|nr:DNA replication/repair protein RecF [Candidatus Rhodobacter lobularis]KMW59014.1 DNA recombination and repair protein RecF [Candidatus Rhodobacter lobularis]